MMNIAYVTVNTDKGEHEYKVDRPDWDMSKVLAELYVQHPSATSMMVALVRVKPD